MVFSSQWDSERLKTMESMNNSKLLKVNHREQSTRERIYAS